MNLAQNTFHFLSTEMRYEGAVGKARKARHEVMFLPDGTILGQLNYRVECLYFGRGMRAQWGKCNHFGSTKLPRRMLVSWKWAIRGYRFVDIKFHLLSDKEKHREENILVYSNACSVKIHKNVFKLGVWSPPSRTWLGGGEKPWRCYDDFSRWMMKLLELSILTSYVLISFIIWSLKCLSVSTWKNKT